MSPRVAASPVHGLPLIQCVRCVCVMTRPFPVLVTASLSPPCTARQPGAQPGSDPARPRRRKASDSRHTGHRDRVLLNAARPCGVTPGVAASGCDDTVDWLTEYRAPLVG